MTSEPIAPLPGIPRERTAGGPVRRDPTVSRFALVTLLLPVCLVSLGTVAQLAARSADRSRVPVHWNGAGQATGTAPWWVPLAVMVVLGVGLPAAFGLSSLPRLRRGERSGGYRIFGAQTLGIAAMQVTVATTALAQPGRATDSAMFQGWLPLGCGLVVGVAATVVGWHLQPRPTDVALARGVAPLDVGPTERVAWMRTTTLPLPALVLILAAIAVVATRAGKAWLTHRHVVRAESLTGVVIVLILLVATTAILRVSVTEDGLRVRSLFGIPRFRVPLGDVVSVSVADARSYSRLAGWGIRARPGRVTIIMRSDTGIRVRRRRGGFFFVTVGDAGTGAALLQALAARGSAPGPLRPGLSERSDHDGPTAE